MKVNIVPVVLDHVNHFGMWKFSSNVEHKAHQLFKINMRPLSVEHLTARYDQGHDQSTAGVVTGGQLGDRLIATDAGIGRGNAWPAVEAEFVQVDGNHPLWIQTGRHNTVVGTFSQGFIVGVWTVDSLLSAFVCDLETIQQIPDPTQTVVC